MTEKEKFIEWLKPLLHEDYKNQYFYDTSFDKVVENAANDMPFELSGHFTRLGQSHVYSDYYTGGQKGKKKTEKEKFIEWMEPLLKEEYRNKHFYDASFDILLDKEANGLSFEIETRFSIYNHPIMYGDYGYEGRV
jgi:disulfide oxidoreductase YuzD